jgi:hypothetical protein
MIDVICGPGHVETTVCARLYHAFNHFTIDNLAGMLPELRYQYKKRGIPSVTNVTQMA